jgi:hypothetical protein
LAGHGLKSKCSLKCLDNGSPKRDPPRELTEIAVGLLTSGSHAPLRFERCGQVIFCEDNILGDLADTVCAITNGSEMHCGHSTSVASNAAGIAHAVRVLELLRWCEIKGRECSRLSEHVSISKLVIQSCIITDQVLTGWESVRAPQMR